MGIFSDETKEPDIKWEKLTSASLGFNKKSLDTYRSKIPGGWLVICSWGDQSLTFVPDPEHKWDGKSI